MSIPKIIWQTHNYEYEDLPIHYKKIAQTWKNLNPDWEYRYVSHTEREDIIKKYPILWNYYPTQTGVCQADMWRYVVTYEHGGVYADMDSVCTKSISYFLDNSRSAEMYVCPPYRSDSSMESVRNRLRRKHLTEEYIDFRLKIQTSRNGVEVYESEQGTMIKTSTTKSSNYAIEKHSKIMEQVIKESENHFIKNVGDSNSQIMLYMPFLHVIHGLENDPSVSFDFDIFKHDDLYKVDFNSDFLVNDNGTEIKYYEYLEKYNLPIFE
jgi:hypothetical protein